MERNHVIIKIYSIINVLLMHICGDEQSTKIIYIHFSIPSVRRPTTVDSQIFSMTEEIQLTLQLKRIKAENMRNSSAGLRPIPIRSDSTSCPNFKPNYERTCLVSSTSLYFTTIIPWLSQPNNIIASARCCYKNPSDTGMSFAKRLG